MPTETPLHALMLLPANLAREFRPKPTRPGNVRANKTASGRHHQLGRARRKAKAPLRPPPTAATATAGGRREHESRGGGSGTRAWGEENGREHADAELILIRFDLGSGRSVPQCARLSEARHVRQRKPRCVPWS
jgi:hypothetical protein